jgi:tetratricopeptide (TPR) repeat protein
LQATDDPIEAANRSFGDLKKLSEKLEAYTRQSAFLYQRMAVNSNISEKDFVARRLSSAEGLVAQADYLVHTDHLPEAIEILHQAEKLDPKVPHLHDELGYYHFVKADFDNSLKEFDAAVAEDANDAIAYYYKASIPYRKTGYTRETTPQMITNLQKVISLGLTSLPRTLSFATPTCNRRRPRQRLWVKPRRPWTWNPATWRILSTPDGRLLPPTI